MTWVKLLGVVSPVTLQGVVASVRRELEASAVEAERGSPDTRNSKPEIRDPKPETRNPRPKAQNPRPENRNSKPETIIPVVFFGAEMWT